MFFIFNLYLYHVCLFPSTITSHNNRNLIMIKLEANNDIYWFKLEDVLLVERLIIYTSDSFALSYRKIRITLKNTNTNTKTIEIFDPDETECDKILSFLEVPDKNVYHQSQQQDYPS